MTVQSGLSDLIGTQICWFSHVQAHILLLLFLNDIKALLGHREFSQSIKLVHPLGEKMISSFKGAYIYISIAVAKMKVFYVLVLKCCAVCTVFLVKFD